MGMAPHILACNLVVGVAYTKEDSLRATKKTVCSDADSPQTDHEDLLFTDL